MAAHRRAATSPRGPSRRRRLLPRLPRTDRRPQRQAADFYQQTYRGSWAQIYLADRLGTDLTGDPHIQPGYAPAGFGSLVSHLRRHGATDAELIAAGLAKIANNGKTIDAFRDRLVLPIHHRGVIVGFVGRRNPNNDRLVPGTDAAVKAGPKYLNTGDTVLFAKGDQLYGMAEHADRLTAGATPVLVEGPIDVLAVALASPDHVGAAPLGTSLTDTQADALTPHLRNPHGVIVATDADLAGQLAAERDYWMLTARGGDPQHVTFPTGQDPASILANHGRAGLRDLLTHTHPLAEVLIDERLNHLPPAQALPAALTVVAAGDAQQWPQRAADIAKRLHLPTDVALTGLLGHINGWDRDRHTSASHSGRLQSPDPDSVGRTCPDVTRRALGALRPTDQPRTPRRPSLGPTRGHHRRSGPARRRRAHAATRPCQPPSTRPGRPRKRPALPTDREHRHARGTATHAAGPTSRCCTKPVAGSACPPQPASTRRCPRALSDNGRRTGPNFRQSSALRDQVRALERANTCLRGELITRRERYQSTLFGFAVS